MNSQQPIPDWLDRVKREHNELTSKLINLDSFINTRQEFKALSEYEQFLLVMQRDAMITYHTALTARANYHGLNLTKYKF